ncbi:ATP-binding cassette sub-family G member 8 [Nymphon striatum]|nr:ATP-binding cassette sub-family G member 8 [Nymphon striatum]
MGDRKFSIPARSLIGDVHRQKPSDDLHIWSIYRQNLNSNFTDSALGNTEKSPLPFGEFQLGEATVQTILSHPKYGPHKNQSELSSNMYTYLRFGLPRVFAPDKIGRDGSSGYDSSDDGIRRFREKEAQKNALRSRSIPNLARSDLADEDVDRDPDPRDPDPRDYEDKNHYLYKQEFSQRHRASSEADLIGADTNVYQKTERRYSEWKEKQSKPSITRDSNFSFDQHRLTPIGHVMQNNDYESRHEFTDIKAESHISGISHKPSLNGNLSSHASRERLLLNGKIRSDSMFSSASPDITVSKHPHLQVRNLGYEIDRSPIWKRLCGLARVKQKVLQNLSFEVFGGEILGIIATRESEGSAILDVLADRHAKWQTCVRGQFIVNGYPVKTRKLSDRVAYVQSDTNFSEDISVRQCLLFMSLLQESANSSRSFDTKGRINALIDDLGLSQVRHTRIKDLTLSEKKRLNVACHLLLDTDIVLLDQPTKGMDIFDTFFLMEYLKTWASRGRIVILTIHPPTFEIFSMLSKIALVSCGKMMYFGQRKEMLPYFAYIDYPCPMYKNPSDYFLDLVTIDDLSSEAYLESTRRVESLYETFRQRQDQLSEPGPPSIPLSKIKKASFAIQIVALWIRALIYMFPYNLIHLFRDCVITCLMSILIGLFFWDVRAGIQQENVNDRFGFYYVMMALGVWPYLLYTISKESKLKPTITRDIKDKLYWKITFILSKICYNFFSSGAVFLAYVIPAYAMAGLREEGGLAAFGVYVGYMLLYLYSIQMVATAMSYAFDSRHIAAGVTGFFFTMIALTSGYTCHPNELSPVFSWFRWASPMKWMKDQLDVWEFSGEDQSIDRYFCARNPVRQGETIVVRSECGITKARHALNYMGNEAGQFYTYVPVLITFAFYVMFYLIAMIFYTCFKQSRKRRRKSEMTT